MPKDNLKNIEEGQFVASDYVGPTKIRHCTDIMFLIIFIMAFICMNGIGFAAVGLISSPYIEKGVPQRLIRGVDYTGAICGIDAVVKLLPYKWEPNALGITPNNVGQFVPIGLGICVSSCPASDESRPDPYGTYGYWVAPVNTVDVLGYCIPFDMPRVENVAETMFGDFIRVAKVIVAIGFVVSVVCSLLFLVTIRIPGVLRSVVWVSIVLIFSIFAAGGYVVLNKVKSDQKLTGAARPPSQQIALEKFLGAALAICSVLWLSAVCVMRERIALAISLVRESVKALLAMPLLIFFPLFQCVMFGLMTLLWLVYSCFLMSSGTVTTAVDDFTGDSYKVINYDNHATMALVFIFFCWLWNIRFLEAFGQLTSAHAVLIWYFADNRRLVSPNQVFASASVCLRYHCGTMAFGSFLLAVLDFIRAVIEYIKLKIAARKSCLARFVGCLLSCLLWLFEKCLQYITENAYIQCALVGTPFCTSAFRSFGLILRNLGRVSAVTAVAAFVMIIGKVSIALTSGGIAYLYLSKYYRNQVSGVVLPSLLVFYVSYRIASLFLSVVSITSNTILQAYIVEEEMAASGSDIRQNKNTATGDFSEINLLQCVSEIKDAANREQENNDNSDDSDSSDDDVELTQLH